MPASQSIDVSNALPARRKRVGSLADYAPNWFAVFTSPRHEKRVAQHFTYREVEFFLPLYHVARQWKNGCKVHVHFPLFPGYIFAHIDRRERMRVLPVPGVLSIVGNCQGPSCVPDAYIESLQEGLRRHKIEPHPYLTIGERVRIIHGAMMGIEGVLVRRKNDVRVVITLEMILQSAAVEIDMADLEPVKQSKYFVAGSCH
jgi:transcription antitermination factor NusG